MDWKKIESRNNPGVKYAVSLCDKKARDREGVFCAEGVTLFLDFAKIGAEIELEKSVVAGNRRSDLLAGINAGIEKTVLIGSDEPDAEEIASAHYDTVSDFSDSEQEFLF